MGVGRRCNQPERKGAEGVAQLVECLPDPQHHIKQRSGISHPGTQKVEVEGFRISIT